MYVCTKEYSDLLLLSKHQRLLAVNLKRGLWTTANQICVYEEILNNFALWTWPDNGLVSLNVPIA